MKTPLLIVIVVLFAGCDTPQSPKPEKAYDTTPALLELFGGVDNLAEVRNAWSSSQLSLPVAMYAGDSLQRLVDLVATDGSYDWAQATNGEFSADITAHFLGPRYHDAANSGRQGKPIIIAFDMQRKLIEVDVPPTKRRASFAPAASRFDDYFASCGFVPRPR